MAGLLGVFLTESVGSTLLQAVDLDYWGRWPLTIHSGAWGLSANIVVCGLVSALSQDRRDHDTRRTIPLDDRDETFGQRWQGRFGHRARLLTRV